VAVTLGTSQEQQVKKFFPNAKIRSIEAPARDFQEVLAGRAQISVTSNLEASLLTQAHSQLGVVPVSEPRTPADLAFIVGQEDQVWLNFLNHSFRNLHSSGIGIPTYYTNGFMDGAQVGISAGRQSSGSTPLVTVLCSVHCSERPLSSKPSLISY
jgi:ABC-type amino acid transport substrate-binding protein